MYFNQTNCELYMESVQMMFRSLQLLSTSILLNCTAFRLSINLLPFGLYNNLHLLQVEPKSTPITLHGF